MFCHANNSYENAPQCYFILTLLILLKIRYMINRTEVCSLFLTQKKCICFCFTSAWEPLVARSHHAHSLLLRINESIFFPAHFEALRLSLKERLRYHSQMFCKHNPSHISTGTNHSVCYQGSAGTRRWFPPRPIHSAKKCYR